MFKIISSEEYSKSTSLVDYWKTQTLKEEKRKNFYENLYKSQKVKVIELIRENQLLDRKLEELKKDKVTFISFGEVKSLRKAREIAEEFKKTLNNEHHCNRYCFTEHVLPAIQSDYDECNYNSRLIQHKFIEYWSEKLSSEYGFVNCICLMNGKIAVKYK